MVSNCSCVCNLYYYSNPYFLCRWRKIQQVGLSDAYKDKESATGRWLHYLFGLTFLSPEEVGDAFSFEFAEEKPVDPRITEFADYLTDNYIDEYSSFPPSVWAANSESITRTTNACESFHAKFNADCSSPHPNINVFLKVILAVQTDTYIKINSVKASRTLNTSVNRFNTSKIS